MQIESWFLFNYITFFVECIIILAARKSQVSYWRLHSPSYRVASEFVSLAPQLGRYLDNIRIQLQFEASIVPSLHLPLSTLQLFKAPLHLGHNMIILGMVQIQSSSQLDSLQQVLLVFP